MPKLVIHGHTKSLLDGFLEHPGHAILLSGPRGGGKLALAEHLAESLLNLPPGNLIKYPHIRFIKAMDGKTIGIDDVRDLEHFLTLKIPGNKPVARIAIIEDSHLLTLEAQNALLKTLEEPPKDTVIILTTTHEQSLLPTIRSRVQAVRVHKPSETELAAFFASAKPQELKQALAISGGLPGLTAALLSESTEHPLVEAIGYARDLLQKNTFERLIMVDELGKRKDLARDVCYVLGHMARLALTKSGNRRWHAIMRAAYDADEALAGNAQPKLALTNLMLQL